MYNPQSVDLTTCDREPIHIPGAIQSHGALIVLVEPDLVITQVSANTDILFGQEPTALLGQPIATLLHASDVRYLQERILPKLLDGTPHYLPQMRIGADDTWFEGIAHRYQGLLLLEFERPLADAELPPQELYAVLRNTIELLRSSTEVTSFCQLAAEQVRAFTGFDRVMVYQFREDESGRVIAEDRRDDLESYLGLHYPASDIPKQARALYLKSWLRLKYAVDDVPVALVPLLNPHTQAPLDLSHAVIRSMSPIHMEYLRNMGVQASLSISLIKDDALWGLIACHHATPRYIPHATRTACEFLAHMLSLQLSAKEEAEDHSYIMRLNTIHTQFVERMAAADLYHHGLAHGEPNLLSWIAADGAAICTTGIEVFGRTPSATQIRELVRWLAVEIDEPVYASSALSQVFPPAAVYSHIASGVLAIRLSKYQPEYLLWFRTEYQHHINWAGDPQKPVQVGPLGERLTPRSSFALFRESVVGTAVPWKRCEIDAATSLHRSVMELVIRRAEKLSKLNIELERSNDELDSFAYVASHDLKEPLRGIHNYSHFLLEDYADRLDQEGVDQLKTLIRLTQRMEALIESLLHYSRLGRTELVFAAVDLNAEVEEVVLLLGSRLRQQNVELRIPRPLPTVHGEAARIGEILSNLITNGIKYNDQEHKWVEIGYVAAEELKVEPLGRPVFYVRDNGIGIPPEHHETIFRIFKRLHSRDAYQGGSGAGLTIVRKIVERHNGKIWVDSQPGAGTTFYFTLNADLLPPPDGDDRDSR